MDDLPIKMVALDLDGTLLDEGKILAEVKTELERVVSRGVTVVIATGRDLESIIEVMGNASISLHSEYPHPHALISEEKFIHYLRDGAYLPDKNWNRKRAEEMKELRKQIGSQSYEWLKAVKKELSTVRENVEMGYFLVIFQTIEDAEQARKIVRQLAKEIKLVEVIRNCKAVGITLSTGLKGNCLNRVAKYYGIPNSRVLAIGDSQIDKDMLDGRYGFIGATTGNAEDSIKEIVKYVAQYSTGLGVVEILRSFTN